MLARRVFPVLIVGSLHVHRQFEYGHCGWNIRVDEQNFGRSNT